MAFTTREEWTMSNRILVPYDGSDGAQRALAYAEQLARCQSDSLYLLAVVEWRVFGIQNPMQFADSQAETAAEIGRLRNDVIAPTVDRLRAAGIDADGSVEGGSVTATVLDVAGRLPASHIVVGRRGGSRLSKLLLGSTSSALVQSADVPVTVVP